MDGYFCVWFIDFMLKGKSLLDYTNSLYKHENNDGIILKYFIKEIDQNKLTSKKHQKVCTVVSCKG